MVCRLKVGRVFVSLSIALCSSRASTGPVTLQEEHLCRRSHMVGWHTCCHGYHSTGGGDVPVRDQFTSPEWHCHQSKGKLSHKTQHRLNIEHQQPKFTYKCSVQVTFLKYTIRHKNIHSNIIFPQKLFLRYSTIVHSEGLPHLYYQTSIVVTLLLYNKDNLPVN